MSETQTPAAEAKAPKKEIVRTAVAMKDGTTVEFAGERNVNKTVLEEDEVPVGVRFDFRNGETRSIRFAELTSTLLARAAAHGLSQKGGDSFASVKTGPDDMVLTLDEVLTQLRAGDWNVVREGGDSLAGASIVIKAIMEVSGKTADDVKAFLQKKLDADKAGGGSLTRQKLYASFRAPNTKTAVVIARMEQEKLSKNVAVNADELLGELG